MRAQSRVAPVLIPLRDQWVVVAGLIGIRLTR
jgi:hypothetical protein